MKSSKKGGKRSNGGKRPSSAKTIRGKKSRGKSKGARIYYIGGKVI